MKTELAELEALWASVEHWLDNLALSENPSEGNNMITFLRFQDYGHGLIAVFADSRDPFNPNEIALGEDNLAERIANLQFYNVDTSVEESALQELRMRKSEQ